MKIGIGCGADPAKIQKSLEKIKDKAEYVLFLKDVLDEPLDWIHYDISEEPEIRLVDALFNGEIDAAVRGTLPSNKTMKALKKRAGTNKLRRVAILQTADNKKFLLAPVGVDEGWSVDEKIEFIREAKPLADKIGLNNSVAVLSGGRFGDIGRHKIVDKTISDAERISELTGSDNCEILIEDAVLNHGIIIAPDGISGNLIFRTLCLLGGGDAHGAPVLNIGKIFVDTSRAGIDYSNAVLLAISLVKK
ncbi:methanogenesis marker protein Mmp4/MtxX [Methanomicrobium antiquum]|uniref:Methanogenesis marker protein Mmp4/MtxX n=1 Tax=Methanomicrobium antiquum TaxID=487686 RepID=A0AAF0FRQ5_9EURY|nr:methanogenesis marker protein Mmp4/MtxX [Methanomicrobium antiquum]WFN37289.1 methanogenesis marker protein Mmp4/MtxX [Methanomicrobium antiquum]